MNDGLTIRDHAMIKTILERLLRDATGPDGVLRKMVTEIVTEAVQSNNAKNDGTD